MPQPLTLEAALSMVEGQHPSLAIARADLAAAQARLQESEASTGVKAGIEGRLRWVEPAESAPDAGRDDHRARLYVSKRLYDSGQSAARRSSALATIQGSEFTYVDAHAQQRIEVMARYFDVLLADLEYARDNEALAVGYVGLDRLRNDYELGRVSDIDLLQKEDEYQALRYQWQMSGNRQRSTRARLAIALNRPGELPADLVSPELPALQRVLPDYELLRDKAMSDNPRVQALRRQLEGARYSIQAAEAQSGITVDAEVEALEYSREFASSDQWRAGVVVHVPLFDSGQGDARVAYAQAQRQRLAAQLQQAEQEVAQEVLELWLELGTLQARLEQVRVGEDYRDLYLDRSRAEYEMELKSDLGDAMVRLSEAQLYSAQVRFEAALAWERLDALIGGELTLGQQQ